MGDVPSIQDFINRKDWERLFPHRFRSPVYGDFYSYNAFLAAASHFPKFLNEGTAEARKRELSAFLATIAQETNGGWKDAPEGEFAYGLYFNEENIGKNTPVYADSTKVDFPPVAGQKYFGRGPAQLSWNYNYGQFSEAWFGDREILLRNPGWLSRDPMLAFGSAIWFWMQEQRPKPSCHDVMVGNWQPGAPDLLKNRLPGFGTVLNIINGGLECNRTPPLPQTASRYGFYRYFCQYFHVEAGENQTCENSASFGG